MLPRRRRQWLELVADDGSRLRLPVEQVSDKLQPGSRIDAAEWADLERAAEYYGLLDTALRILGRREHFSAELKRKLRQRTSNRDLVERVLGECDRRNYLDDRRAAEITVQRLVDRGGISRAT